MVINDIKHYTDACLVQSLYHLLELADTDFRTIGIDRIRAFGHIVVQWVVAPVVFVFIQTGLIDRSIVVRRQDMHVRHTQFLQVVDAGSHSAGVLRTGLGHGQELALMLDAR